MLGCMSSPSPARPALSERLQSVTEALAAAQTQAEVLRVVMVPALEALDAVAGAVLLVSAGGDRLELAAQQPPGGAPTLWQDGPLDREMPSGDALARREALFFEREGELVRAYPVLAAGTAEAAIATAVLPMFLDQRPLGTIVLDFREPHDFTPEEVRFLRTLASQCALALGRARLLVSLEEQLAQRRHSEQSLRRSEARFRRMVETSPVAIAAGDLSGHLTLVNDAYLDMLGYTRAEFEAGKIDWLSLTPAEFQAADEQAFRQALEGGASAPYEKEMLTRSGERLSLGAVLTRYDDSEQALVVGHLQNLSTHRAAERVLRAHSAELERQVAERTQESDAARVRAEVLAALGDALQGATSPEQVADEALATLGPALRALSMLVVRLDGAAIRLPTLWGRNPEAITHYMTRPGLCLDDAPMLARVARSGAGIYADNYQAEPGMIASFPALASGVEPIRLPDGTLEGFVVVWRLPEQGPWLATERDLLRRAAETLGLALERAEQARRLTEQHAELDARTRALEGFADLTRDLGVDDDPYTLIRRAQQVVLSLLPEGYAVYYEPEQDRWVLRAQTGDLRSAALQAVVDAGLPYEETRNLLTPYTTLAPYYQDQYAHDTDHLGSELVADVGASATLPVLVGGRPQGVFAVVLFGEMRPWSGAERAVLETVVRSLGLALERAQGVAELARRTQELARSNAELEQFAYVASHDLQAPIRAVTSFAGLLERRYSAALDARGQLYLRQIMDSGEHMKRLMDDLLAYSRVHTERRALQPADAAAVFDIVARRLEAAPESAGARITRGDLPAVVCDAQQLDQLLQNLLSNGLKYRREGVTPQLHVSATRQGEFWCFAVRDNGIGIERQYRERIFVIFQRLHTREAFEGTGIGLAVCKKIVELHGGELWVDSTPGEGSTFFFTLPAA